MLKNDLVNNNLINTLILKITHFINSLLIILEILNHRVGSEHFQPMIEILQIVLNKPKLQDPRKKKAIRFLLYHIKPFLRLGIMTQINKK